MRRPEDDIALLRPPVDEELPLVDELSVVVDDVELEVGPLGGLPAGGLLPLAAGDGAGWRLGVLELAGIPGRVH